MQNFLKSDKKLTIYISCSQKLIRWKQRYEKWIIVKYSFKDISQNHSK